MRGDLSSTPRHPGRRAYFARSAGQQSREQGKGVRRTCSMRQEIALTTGVGRSWAPRPWRVARLRVTDPRVAKRSGIFAIPDDFAVSPTRSRRVLGQRRCFRRSRARSLVPRLRALGRFGGDIGKKLVLAISGRGRVDRRQVPSPIGQAASVPRDRLPVERARQDHPDRFGMGNTPAPRLRARPWPASRRGRPTYRARTRPTKPSSSKRWE